MNTQVQHIHAEQTERYINLIEALIHGTLTDEDKLVIQSILFKLMDAGIYTDVLPVTNVVTAIRTAIIGEVAALKQEGFTRTSLLVSHDHSKQAEAQRLFRQIEDSAIPSNYQYDAMASAAYGLPIRSHDKAYTSGQHVLAINQTNGDNHKYLYSVYKQLLIGLIHLGIDTEQVVIPFERIDEITDVYLSDVYKIYEPAFVQRIFRGVVDVEELEALRQVRLRQAMDAMDNFFQTIALNALKDSITSHRDNSSSLISEYNRIQRKLRDAELKLYAMENGLETISGFSDTLMDMYKQDKILGYSFNDHTLFVTAKSYLFSSSSMESVIISSERRAGLADTCVLKAIDDGRLKIPMVGTLKLDFKIRNGLLIVDKVSGKTGHYYDMDGNNLGTSQLQAMRNAHIYDFNCFSNGKGQIKKYFGDGNIEMMFAAACEAVGNVNFYDGAVAPKIHQDIVRYMRTELPVKLRTLTGWQTIKARDAYEILTTE